MSGGLCRRLVWSSEEKGVGGNIGECQVDGLDYSDCLILEKAVGRLPIR